MPLHWPFNSQPTPAGIPMYRNEYDPNNDGVIDNVNNQNNVVITSNGLNLKNTDTGLWNLITVSGADGSQTLNIAPGSVTPT